MISFFFSSHLVGSSSYGRDVMFEFIFEFEIYMWLATGLRRLYAMMMDKWTVNILTTTDEFPLVVSSLSSFLLGSLFIGGDYINRCWFIDFNISNNKHSFKIFPPRPCVGRARLLWCDFSLPVPFYFISPFHVVQNSCCCFFSFRWLALSCVSISFDSLFKFPAEIYSVSSSHLCVDFRSIFAPLFMLYDAIYGYNVRKSRGWLRFRSFFSLFLF